MRVCVFVVVVIADRSSAKLSLFAVYFLLQPYISLTIQVGCLSKPSSLPPPGHQHFDAFNLDEEDGRRFASNGGQRTVTVLVYLNDVAQGGATSFPALNLQVQPREGMALVFFPATIDGALDKQALHAALPAVDTKFVSQIWIRQSNYYGQPSKRLAQTMGVPLHATPATLPNLAAMISH